MKQSEKLSAWLVLVGLAAVTLGLGGLTTTGTIALTGLPAWAVGLALLAGGLVLAAVGRQWNARGFFDRPRERKTTR